MIGSSIKATKNQLIAGDVVGIPTETVYGLAANAYDPVAVHKIYTIKNRPLVDPLIVHAQDEQAIEEFVTSMPKQAEKLAEVFWPGPLTLLLPKKAGLPNIVTANLPTVAVRIPSHPLVQRLLAELDFPLVAPSANPFGYISPTTAMHVEAQLGAQVGYILDGGSCTLGLESTIIGFPGGVATLYRLGSIPVEEIEKVVGSLMYVTKLQGSEPIQAPGTLPSHYAPHTPLVVGNLSVLLPQYIDRKVGLLTFDQHCTKVPNESQICLSSTGDLTIAAHNLFDALRRLDNMSFDIILASKVPGYGLGRTINERLTRAAYDTMNQEY